MRQAYRNIVPIRGTKTHKYSIIIPAAGMGLRMKSYGVKSLIKLKPNLTILDHQLNIIHRTIPNNEIILVTGFESTKLMNNAPSNIIQIENERYEETNVLRSISMGLRAVTTTNVLVIYGDLVFNSHTLNIPLNKLSKENKSALIVGSNIMSDDEIGCTIVNDKVEYLSYNLPVKWSQITFFTGKELSLLQQIAWNQDKEKWYGFEALNYIIEKGGEFQAITPNKIQITDVDSSKDFPMAKQIL